MNVQENISLRPFNTFGIEASAKYFARANTEEDIKDLLESPVLKSNKLLVLGGGSNILLTQNYNGIVIKNDIKGIHVVAEEKDDVFVQVGAGENWHAFVMWCIENDLAGVENLSLIPGNVGASPMQNIGAYGVEIKDRFEKLNAIEIATGEVHTFNGEDCEFAYRESIFKRRLKDMYIITDVIYRLSKTPEFNTSYGAIEQELERMGIEELSIGAISNAVINIRRSKLPDPRQIGNSGSFFKNPIIPVEQVEKLRESYPDMPTYPVSDTHVKAAAGWLIDKAGWKGLKRNGYGVHKKQALVLVNYGGASGSDIYNLSQEIKDSISERFGIELEREVNII